MQVARKFMAIEEQSTGQSYENYDDGRPPKFTSMNFVSHFELCN